MAVIGPKIDEVEQFKEKVIKDFLKKHGLKPDDVRPDVINTSGYSLNIERNQNVGFDDDRPEVFKLTLYKLIDSESYNIHRKIQVSFIKDKSHD